MKTNNEITAIAFYLPQFHPIEDNDIWWGKGFTEWTNVGKAKKYFKNHYQPRIPKDLVYYDLRVSETRKSQADLAKKFGINAFCYWHYWFGNGKKLLDRPITEVVNSGEPDFPFCLGWANETWKGFNHGLINRNVLIEQLYPGTDDIINHFYSLLDTFKDKRYLRVDGKLVFLIYQPLADESIKEFIKVWRKLAQDNGLNDFYFIGHSNGIGVKVDRIMATGVDAINTVRLSDYFIYETTYERRLRKLLYKFTKGPQRFKYAKLSSYFFDKNVDNLDYVIPSIITGWDHTPRSGKHGLVLTDYTPQEFKNHLSTVFSNISNKENKLVFIKSWNEWAEGNYLEPDLKYDKQFLEVFLEEKEKHNFK